MDQMHTINRSVERIGAGRGGGLPLLSMPVLIGLGVWAFISADTFGGGYIGLGALLVTAALDGRSPRS